MRQQYNCIICGHVTGRPFCQGCMGRAKEYYEIILDYINANPDATVTEIYNSTSIPLSIIRGIIQMGWMEQSS